MNWTLMASLTSLSREVTKKDEMHSTVIAWEHGHMAVDTLLNTVLQTIFLAFGF